MFTYFCSATALDKLHCGRYSGQRLIFFLEINSSSFFVGLVEASFENYISSKIISKGEEISVFGHLAECRLAGRHLTKRVV